MTIINLSQNGMFITIGGAIKAALRVSSEMQQRHAQRPSDDLALYDNVRQKIVQREPTAASEAMTKLLKASLARVLPITAKL